MEIVIGSRNSDKIKEIIVLLKDVDVKILTLNDFSEFDQVKETGKTLKENAEIKAIAYSKFTKKLTLAEDSGLEVDILGGIPGIQSSRFAGEDASYEDNNRKLLKLLEGVPPAKRTAKFVCFVSLALPQELIKTVKAVCKGSIAFNSQGNEGFGYDPIFIPEGYNKSFAELGLGVKNSLSHRFKALYKAKKVLTKFLESRNRC